MQHGQIALIWYYRRIVYATFAGSVIEFFDKSLNVSTEVPINWGTTSAMLIHGGFSTRRSELDVACYAITTYWVAQELGVTHRAESV